MYFLVSNAHWAESDADGVAELEVVVGTLEVARAEDGVATVAATLLVTAGAAEEDATTLPALELELALVLRVVAAAEELNLSALETLEEAEEAAFELALLLALWAILEASEAAPELALALDVMAALRAL